MKRRGLVLAALAVALLAHEASAATYATASAYRQSSHGRAEYGGAQVAIHGSGGSRYNLCGLGIGWRLSNGARKVALAGHCVGTAGGGTKTVYYRSPSGTRVASVYSMRYGSGRDVALLTPRYSIAQYAYQGSTSTTRLIRLDGFVSPQKGMTACVSGAYRGTSCGWTLTRWVDVYDTNHAHLGLQYEGRHALVNGRCPAGSGDSGSTVYQPARDGTWALGMMSAGQTYSSYCTMSFVTINSIRQIYGGEPITRATP